MRLLVGALLALALLGCGGGEGGDGGPTVAAPGCSGGCAAATPTALTIAEVNRIVSQAEQEALARGALATIAVVDRSGNVLAVYRMGAATNVTISSGRGLALGNGLEQQLVPSFYAAISKAITGAYLSSEGNAFSTRTASQIVQENFNPGENNSPGGPLFGVQFSSLSCSDVVTSVGPKPSPLGLAADPGGLPLYKNGIVVGGIGAVLAWRDWYAERATGAVYGMLGPHCTDQLGNYAVIGGGEPVEFARQSSDGKCETDPTLNPMGCAPPLLFNGGRALELGRVALGGKNDPRAAATCVQATRRSLARCVNDLSPRALRRNRPVAPVRGRRGRGRERWRARGRCAGQWKITFLAPLRAARASNKVDWG